MISISDFFRLLSPLSRKVSMLIGKATVKEVNNSGTNSFAFGDQPQRLKVEALANETLSNMARSQEYGLETYPKSDSEAIMVFIDGDRDNGTIISVSDKSARPTDLSQGDVCLYDADGSKVLCSGGKIAIGNSSPMLSTPPAEKTELIELVDRLLTLLSGTVNAPGIGSGPTFLPSVLAELNLIQGDLANIKGEL